MSQQIGAALGITAMTAISTAVTSARLAQAVSSSVAGSVSSTAATEALAAGYSLAFLSGSALLLAAAAIVGWAINTQAVQRTAGTLGLP